MCKYRITAWSFTLSAAIAATAAHVVAADTPQTLPAQTQPAPRVPNGTDINGQPMSVSKFDANAADAALKIERGAGFLVTADVKINGQSLGYFIIDTGADHSVIDTKVAQKLGLKTDSPAGTVAFYTVDSVSLGGMTVNNHLLPALSMAGFAASFKVPIAGLIGGDLFGKAPYTLDTLAGTLTFHNPKSFKPPQDADVHAIKLSGKLSTQSDHGVANPTAGIPITTSTIDGIECRTLLDGGATMPLAINSAMTAKHRELVDWDRGPSPATMSLASPGEPYTAKVGSVTVLGDQFKELHHSMAFVASPGRPVGSMSPDIDATVGAPILQQFILTFDYSTGKLWAKRRSLPTVQDSLKAGMNANAADLSGRTALMDAASKGDEAGCAALIKAGADAHAKDVQQKDAFFYAVSSGNAATVKLVVDAAGKDNLDAKGQNGAAIISEALDSTDPAVLAAVLDLGADPNLRDKLGQTPLHYAAQRSNAPAAELLLSRQAQPDLPSMTGATPLDIAAEKGSVKIFDALLNAGVTPKTDPFGHTILHTAARGGHAPMVSHILTELPKRGVKIEVDAKNREGITPLMLAARAGDVETNKALVDAGADVNAAANSKATPLHHAVLGDRAEVVKYLISKKAQIDAKTEQGITPLAAAAVYGKANAAKALLDAGADVTVKSNEGLTPLELAQRGKHDDIVKLLEGK